MTRSLVIVESPAKAKTIEKFLGRGYHVEASMGHVRDLPRSQLGVDVEHGFEPRYITIRGKGAVVQRLREQAAKADRVLLATDPDREGEAIAWHLAALLGLDPSQPCRVSFSEITKSMVQDSIRKPHPVDADLVDAQQARRVLDRLVGYKLSPLLWRKVRRGLSAGRVQSAAVRLICDREDEVEAFTPEEYWTVHGLFGRGADRFTAVYHGAGGEKVQLRDQEAAEAVVARCRGASFHVDAVRRRERRRTPPQPFTTSTLQQEAARKLGFGVARTMRVAQELYEGLPVEEGGRVGLITYMRTDSTRVAEQARDEAREFILSRYGPEFSEPRRGGAHAGAQDAHEAVRPTSVERHPDDLKRDLGRDQLRLYRLIWERFVASQMSAAVYDTVSVSLAGDTSDVFRASGSTLRFAGYRILYIEGSDEPEGAQQDQVSLPELHEGEQVSLVDIRKEQHFTEPPPRYTEASLVKALEEFGIGRPSTYAPIIETIQERGYVEKQDKRLRPTELGRIVTDLLKAHFPDIVSVEFTAEMEERLDQVEGARLDWRALVQDFYGGFASTLERAEADIGRVEVPVEETDEVCENCGRRMVVKHGRFGRFLACPGYPECKTTKPYYERIGVHCPKCGGEVVERRSRKGRIFYGCDRYPECDFVSWRRPAPVSCPACGGLMVVQSSRKAGTRYRCVDEACGRTILPEREETLVSR